MKPSVSRRDVIDGLVEEMRSMGVENPSTRRGKNPGTFHMDGKAFVGRGSVDPEPMQRGELVELFETVFRALPDRRWAHFSYGGYSRQTVAHAAVLGIALFEFDQNCLLTPLTSKAKVLYNKKPERGRVRRARRIVWSAVWVTVICALALGAAYLLPNSASAVSTLRWVGIFFLALTVLYPVSAAFTADARTKAEDVLIGAAGCFVIGAILVGFSFLWGSVSGV